MCDAAKRGSIDENGTHNNCIADEPTIRLNLTMKLFIRDQTQLKKTPSRILNAIIDKGHLPASAYAYLKCRRYSYHYRTTAMHDNNNVDEMEALLSSRPYHSGIHESTAFAFGYATDGAGKPALTRGSSERPVVFGFSSKNLLRNLAHADQHVLHVDATFKLNTARFPAIVLVVSDVRRQFHPVAFFITSDLRHKQVEKIVSSVVKQFEVVTGTPARFRYVMADADVAQRNAIEAVIAQELGVTSQPAFLMCFFNVMQNVKKHISSVPASVRPVISKHIYRIHYARSPTDLNTRIQEAVDAWKLNTACRDFERYFSQQWLTGRFTHWQSLCTPPGFAKTNNPLEQFNKEIKRDYSLRSLVSVNALAQSFLDMCHHRSARAKPFATTPHASDDQGRRYRLLHAAGRLAVTSAYRSSIELMTGNADRRCFVCFRAVLMKPRSPTRVQRRHSTMRP